MIESESNILYEDDSLENAKPEQDKQDEPQVQLVDNLGTKAECIEKDPRYLAMYWDVVSEWTDGKFARPNVKVLTFVEEAKKRFIEEYPGECEEYGSENLIMDPEFTAIYQNPKFSSLLEDITTSWKERHHGGLFGKGSDEYNSAYGEKHGIPEEHIKPGLVGFYVEELFREKFPADTRRYDYRLKTETDWTPWADGKPDKVPPERTSIKVDGIWINIKDLKPFSERS